MAIIAKTRSPPIFGDRADVRHGPDDLVAGDVHKERRDDESDGEHRDPDRRRVGWEELKGVGAEGSGHQALVDDHRERHEERGGSRHGALAVRLLEDHGDAARRWVGAGDLDVAVRAEAADYRRDDERDRKEASRQLGYLPGECEDPGSDHHAGAHRDRTQQAEAALTVLG
jgi:hypothetical protein